jgi:hypothetical protein
MHRFRQGEDVYREVDAMRSVLEEVLLSLQAFQVAFLWLHDWIPLGRFNNVAAVHAQDTRQRLVVVTVLSSLFYSVGLLLSLQHFGEHYPPWLRIYLWVIYAGLLLGQLRAWWVPYLFLPDSRRATRYRLMFANTHSFLPERNGITPNTLHVILHVTTAVTLAILFVMELNT